MTGPRRGRPPGRPIDPTPADGAAFHSEVRVGWLLRGWRLAREPHSSARSFATVLGDLDQSADASRVSRWETGQLAAPLDVIAAYEKALRLPAGSLAATALGTRRLPATVDQPSLGLPVHRFTVTALEHAVDAVVDGAPTGDDWFRFAVLVASRPDHVTLSTSTWRRLTATLVGQLALSVASAYATRVEAALLLTRHPRAGQALVQSIGEHVINPESLLVVDPLSLLTEMRDPRANDLVLRLLEQHEPGPVLNGALWAASSKVSRMQLDAEELRRLERAAVHLARREGLGSGGLFHRVADLVAVLPEDARERISRAVGMPTGPGTGTVASAAARRPAASAPWDRAVVSRVCESLVGREEYGVDPLLDRLLEETLFHVNAERRFQAAITLTFSPHRDRLGTAAAGLVQRHLDGAGDVEDRALERVMLLLTFIANDTDRSLVHRVIAEGPPQLRGSALLASAHLPPSTSRPELRHLITGADRDLAQQAMYSAGMTRHPCLGELADDPAAPEWARRAAVWWLREGPAIHEPGPARAEDEGPTPR